MKVNIKNYTSTIAAAKSIARIEDILISIGADHINKNYKDGQLVSISFMVLVNGQTMPFKLPAKVDKVYEALKKTKKILTTPVLRNLSEQSARTAWKICCDWVEIQATLIRLEQVEFIEVFLPYVYQIERDQTFFESLKQSNYKALLQ